MQIKKHLTTFGLPLLALLLIGVLNVSGKINNDSGKTTSQKTEVSKLEKIEVKTNKNTFNVKNLMADLEKGTQGNIVMSDIERGWYLGKENEKKFGTPNNWIHIEKGEQSKWVSSNYIEELEIEEEKALCLETGGQFLYSCLETTKSECEYTSKSTCYCPEETSWEKESGCS